MTVVARQPILDRTRRTTGRATLEVIDTSFHVVGLDALTGRRRALLKGYATSLPRECLVVKVLEDLAPDAEVLEACRGLKAAGYPVALDDVITSDLPGVLVDLADIVKVDFRLTDRATRSQIARAFRGRGVRLLAEKVESDSDEGVILVPDDPGLAELGIGPDALPVMVSEAQMEAERARNMLDAA